MFPGSRSSCSKTSREARLRSSLAIIVVVLIFAVVLVIVTAMMFVPAAMLSLVLMPITVISIMIPVAVVVPIMVTIARMVSFPIPVAAAAWAAIPGSATPRSAAAGRYVGVGSIRWNAIMLIDVPHPAFHTTGFTLVVGAPVVLPTGVIAVKAALIANGKPYLRLGEMRQHQRREQSHECKQLLH